MVTSRFTLGAALVVLVQLIVPTAAAAQASREGPSFGTAGGWGTVRYPDVAFDPGNAVYLTVSGNLTPRPVRHSERRAAGRPVLRADRRVAQPERARRLQPRPGRVPGRLVRHPRQPQRLPGVGTAGPVRPERRAAVHRPRLLHRGAGGRRQRRDRPRRRLCHRLAALPRRLQPDRTRGYRRPTRRPQRRARRRPPAGHLRRPPSARAERRLQPGHRLVHGGVGTLRRLGRPARPHRRRVDRGARHPARDRHRQRRLRAAARVRLGTRAVLRRLVHAAQRLRPPDRGRRHADRRPVAARLQLLHLRRARPVVQPGRRRLLRRLPRPRPRGRRRPDLGRGHARRRVRRDADGGGQRQLQPAYHEPSRHPRMADGHVERFRADHRAADQDGRRRGRAAPATSAPAASAATTAAPRASS